MHYAARPLATADAGPIILMHWTPGSFLALPEDATAFAWSAPLRELSGRIGISDVALKKLLNGQGILTPPQGHWNRVHSTPVVQSPRRRGLALGAPARLAAFVCLVLHMTELAMPSAHVAREDGVCAGR